MSAAIALGSIVKTGYQEFEYIGWNEELSIESLIAKISNHVKVQNPYDSYLVHFIFSETQHPFDAIGFTDDLDERCVSLIGDNNKFCKRKVIENFFDKKN